MKIAAITAASLAVFGGVTAAGRSSNGCTPPPNVPSAPDAAADNAPLPQDAAAVADGAGGAGATNDAAAVGPCDFVGPRVVFGSGKRRSPRIVGGTGAPEGKYPFAVALTTSTRFQYCGGTLLSPRHVLTAAHCQVGVGDLALVGSVDLNKSRSARVVESRIHRFYDTDTMDNDVAIAVLGEDAASSSFVTLATISPGTATTIGWGATREGGPSTSFLQQVDVPVWSSTDCRRVYPSLTDRQVCAGRVLGGADSCQGDSGGALLVAEETTASLSAASQPARWWRQLGVVSYGVGCARPNVPGVYTDLRAPEIQRWIAACTR